jgi:hypothetical protein
MQKLSNKLRRKIKSFLRKNKIDKKRNVKKRKKLLKLKKIIVKK